MIGLRLRSGLDYRAPDADSVRMRYSDPDAFLVSIRPADLVEILYSAV